MPRGYRLLGAAALGISVIVSFGTGAYSGALYATYNSNHSKEAAYSIGKPEQGNPSQIDRDRAGLPDFAERIASAPDPKDADEREKRDLAAQEASALWSFWMLFATAFSAVITTIGTGILLWQIILTRQAVEGTGEATEAMQEANQIAAKVAHKQLRPYVFVKSVGALDPSGVEKRVLVTFQNYGQTPAENVDIYRGGFRRCKHGSLIAPKFSQHKTERIRPIGPTAESLMFIDFSDCPDWKGTIERIYAGLIVLVCTVRIDYDISPTERDELECVIVFDKMGSARIPIDSDNLIWSDA